MEVAYHCHFYCQEERYQKRVIHSHLATSRLTEVLVVCILSCNSLLASHMTLSHYHPYRKDRKIDGLYEVITTDSKWILITRTGAGLENCSLCILSKMYKRNRLPALCHNDVVWACDDIRHSRIERCNLERDRRSCKCTETKLKSRLDLIPLTIKYLKLKNSPEGR